MTPFDCYVDDYDDWFDAHPAAFASEVEAIRALLPRSGEGLEIGVGTGRFACALGIRFGLEPAERMRERARQRGIDVIEGVAEAMPIEDARFDYATMVTVDCFLDDLSNALEEAHRILKPEGVFVVGMIDRESPLGRMYGRQKEHSRFFRDARLHSVPEMMTAMSRAGFVDLDVRQTLFGDPETMQVPDPDREGSGDGGFVAIRGVRPV